MSSPATIIYFLFLNGGKISGSGDWQGFVGFLPDQPDNAVCLFDTTGIQDGRIMETGERIDHPGIQVTVRGLDYDSTFSKANELALFLDLQAEVSVETESGESYCLHCAKRTGTLNYLGVDTQGSRRRHVFTVNTVLTLTEN